MLNFLDKDLKSTILNVFSDINYVLRIKVKKKNVIKLRLFTKERNCETEPSRNSGVEKYNNLNKKFTRGAQQ